MKKKYIKWMIAALSIILIAIVVSLFWDTTASFFNYRNHNQKEKEEQTEINFVYAFQNAQWNQAVVSAITKFEEENPDVKINYRTGYEDMLYEDVLNKLNARRELGDIIQIKTPYFYAKSDVLAPVSREVSDLVFSKYEYNEKVYAVGAIGATVGIVYNKTLFDRYGLSEPGTYDEFFEICKILKDNGKTPVIVGGADLWNMEFWVNHFFRMDILWEDPDWLQKCLAGETNWQDEKAYEMFEHLTALFNSGYIDESWLDTPDGSLPYLMARDDAGMMYTGSWTISSIQELNPKIEIGWFYLPDEEGEIAVGENRDVFWAVTKECGEDEKKYKAAMRFLEFFYTSDNYMDICVKMNALYSTNEAISYENSGEVQKSVINDFERNDTHITSYIGNEYTPEGFEKKLLTIVIDAIQGKQDIRTSLKLCDFYWKEYSAGENTDGILGTD